MGLVGGQVPLRDGSLGATQTNAVFTSVCVWDCSHEQGAEIVFVCASDYAHFQKIKPENREGFRAMQLGAVLVDASLCSGKK